MSSLVKNVKNNCNRNYADVPFSTWKVAAEKLRDNCNFCFKEEISFQGLSFEGLMLHGDVAKECF